MKKKIAVLLAMLFILPTALAATARISVDEKSFSIGKAYYDVQGDEIVVCVNKDKTRGHFFAPSANYVSRLNDMLASMQGANGYDHFGCKRERV